MPKKPGKIVVPDNELEEVQEALLGFLDLLAGAVVERLRQKSMPPESADPSVINEMSKDTSAIDD